MDDPRTSSTAIVLHKDNDPGQSITNVNTKGVDVI